MRATSVPFSTRISVGTVSRSNAKLSSRSRSSIAPPIVSGKLGSSCEYTVTVPANDAAQLGEYRRDQRTRRAVAFDDCDQSIGEHWRQLRGRAGFRQPRTAGRLDSPRSGGESTDDEVDGAGEGRDVVGLDRREHRDRGVGCDRACGRARCRRSRWRATPWRWRPRRSHRRSRWCRPRDCARRASATYGEATADASAQP